jgi:hypothetical protein
VGIVLAATLIHGCPSSDGPKPTNRDSNSPLVFHGSTNVLFHRNSVWLEVTDPRALPLKVGDHFVVDVQIDPRAYLYVFWVDPDGAYAPIYPWKTGWGSRPPTEKQVSHLRLPEESDFVPDRKKPLDGVTTIVAFACTESLPLPDMEVQWWFKDLPPIVRPKGDTRAVVWFDDYIPPRGGSRLPQVTGLIDPYERWQVELKKRVGTAVAFETSISFAQGNE